MKFGIVGAAGYWGPNWVRVLSQVDLLGACCDVDKEALKQVADRFSLSKKGVALTNSFDNLLGNDGLDGIFVVTPPATHKELAVAVLNSGKHVFIEKPVAMTVEECEEIRSAADSRKRTVMVGHTFIFHPAVRKFKEVLHGVGKLRTILTVRANFGKYQKIGIINDLLPHDLSIFRFLCQGDFSELVSYVNPNQDNAFFSARIGEVYCNSFLSWGYPDKTRKLSAIGDEGILEWDLSETHLFFHSKRITQKHNGAYEHFDEGTKNIMVYDQSEPLLNEAMHFCESIQNKTAPMAGIDDGIAVVRALEQCR